MTAAGVAPVPRATAALRAGKVPLSFILLIGAWLFDFQSGGEGQGLAFQAVFLGAYLFGLIGFLIGDRGFGRSIAGMNAFLIAGLLFLAVGIVSGMLHGQQFYPILRNAISVFVFVSTAYVSARAMMSVNLKLLRKFLAIACFGYVLSTLVIYNLMSGGVDLAVVRFQIIGSSSIAALAYVSLAVLFRLSFVELATLGINLVILLLSITRTFLFAFVAQALALALSFRRLFGGKLFIVALAGMIALVGLETFGQSQIERWRDRLMGESSGNSQYETYYTRLSEWGYMYDSWTASPKELLIGSGFAAETTYYYTSEQGGTSEHMVGFGHNQYLSAVFTAGAIGGLPLLLIQILQGVLAFRFLRQIVRRPDLRGDAAFLGSWGAMIVLGTLAANFFTNTYTQRGVALWYAIGTGLLLAALSGRPATRTGTGPRAPARPSAPAQTRRYGG